MPATQSNSGNIHQPPAPQVHVHASQDQDEVEMSRNTPLNMLRTGSPANSALSSHSHPGSSASSPTGHLAASLNQLGTGPGLSPHTGLPVTGTSNASLSAPAPLYHQGQYGSPGSLGESGNQLEGRISPRPVSRNRSRNSHYQDMLFNPDGYDRPPGDTRMQLFVGNVSGKVRPYSDYIVTFLIFCLFSPATFSGSLARPQRSVPQMWLRPAKRRCTNPGQVSLEGCILFLVVR